MMIDTDRLILRPFTLDDAEAWLPLISLPDIIRYTGETPATSVDQAREILRTRPLRDYSVHGYGRMAVIEKCTGRLVGFSGLKFLEDLGEVDVGYRFLPDCWGKGYATESARLLMEQGRCTHGITRFVGMAHPDNSASIKVLEKLGLVFERTIALEGHASPYCLFSTPRAG